jgi:O-acetyl-ADP-ribose deacetylase (regulator of RNase III)
MTGPFEVLVGRIETLALDAVVNAANTALLPGSGVDGALRAAAGPDLTKHTSRMPPIAEGEAVITPGFNAPARFIIHVAAPVWTTPGEEGEKVKGLARCYMSAIKMAGSRGFSALAFPCLGTGNFGWPRGFACAIAIAACEQALTEAPSLTRVVFCCFTEDDAKLYRAGLAGESAALA